ncbi:DMT family transporter [Marinomonas sp. 15G1-11]|uniref:DMT family transporter n=1 Tax=Marinomonas phaeophyticola TaxID=3004091 RepID=A0ABT4JUF2_9GAMM|nr:DMT family transporter [Marinomonas sp. 15G1-11]MCZ2721970.1 DMT family transporter [Marinomonas sp. 15G1-11]
MSNKSSLINVLLWVILASMWGSSFAMIKLGVASLDPVVIVAGRMLIGAVLIFCVLIWAGQRLSSNAKVWLSYTIAGLLGSTIPFVMITYGEQSVDSALASILMGVAPVATVVLAATVLPDEKLTKRVVTGLVFAVMGVVILVGPSALHSLGDDFIGQLSIICAALCYAANTVYVKCCVRRPALEMASGSTLVGAFSILLVTFFMGKHEFIIEPTMMSIGAVVYLGVFSTGCANLIYFYLVPRIGATRMSQINFAVPVMGSLIGFFFLNEMLTLRHLLALAVIVFAVYLVLSGAKPSAGKAHASQ